MLLHGRKVMFFFLCKLLKNTSRREFSSSNSYRFFFNVNQNIFSLYTTLIISNLFHLPHFLKKTSNVKN